MHNLSSLFTALCLAVLIIVGDIAAVTLWIPHAGHHGHAPTVLGYIALYTLAAMTNLPCWGLVIFGPIADAID
jgi:hypothetical protein